MKNIIIVYYILFLFLFYFFDNREVYDCGHMMHHMM